jgi:flagellar hook-associated protein 3 FlgL
MASITPVPTTRVSDSLVRQRLLTQLQSDELALFRLQNAVSTGRRISSPSEDAPAAQRAISLQSLLERKKQAQTNLETNQSFLAASDAALSAVSGVLADVRGAAVSVADSISTPAAKQAVAQQVDRAIQQLVDTANQRFRDRYLFAGTQSTGRPFEPDGDLVRYNGNEGRFQSFSDIDLLFDTNLQGNELFGALSSRVQGTADLTPNLSASTRLSELNGGQGIRAGSIAISDGLNTSIIDISGAETVGDIERLIEANPPEGTPPTGRTVSVTITATGINLQLNGSSGAGLTIKEVGGGTTAAELGILTETGVGVGPVVGSDLDPLLTKTTRLADLPGGLDQTSGLRITNGGNTYVIDFTTAVTVEDILNKLNGSPAGVLAEINATGTGINVRSRLSGGDFSIGENGGTTATDLGLRSFLGSARLETLNHGFGVHTREGDDFQIRLKNGTLLSFDVSSSSTIDDVIAQINAAGGGLVTAQLNGVGNGIELVTNDPSTNAQFAVLKINGSQAAVDLGLIPMGQETSAPPVVVGATEVITGRDVHPAEAKGIFNALVRLRDALRTNDVLQIGRSVELLDDAVLDLNFSRAELGARQQGLDVLQARLENEQINLEESLSKEIDVDFVEVVSELTSRQAAFQASLQLAGKTFQLTLLDYL